MSGVSVSVLMPYRPDGSACREANERFVRQWWADMFPGWEVVTAAGPLDGPWSKGAAVAQAAARAAGSIAVVADADVLCPGVAKAVTAVAQGAPWAMPHKAVLRLSEPATRMILGGDELPDAPIPRRLVGSTLCEVHPGVLGGGIVVLPMTTLADIPIDPRFEGWGQEDMSWAWALQLLAGQYWRGSADLWHLWHEPAARLNRAVGSDESRALYVRYRAAPSANAMRQLLDEFRLPSDTVIRSDT